MQSVRVPPIKQPGDLILAKLHVWANEFFLQVPNIAAAAVFLLLAWGLARTAAWGVRKLLSRRKGMPCGCGSPGSAAISIPGGRCSPP